MKEETKRENTRLYKGIIIVLAIGIVVMGAFLVANAFTPEQPDQTMEMAKSVGEEAGAMSFAEVASTGEAPDGSVYQDSVEGGDGTEAPKDE